MGPTFCPHSVAGAAWGLRSAHTAVFMCSVFISEQTAIISLYKINWLVFITETESVYCAVRTGYLSIIQVGFGLLKDSMNQHSVYQLRSWQTVACCATDLLTNDVSTLGVKDEPYVCVARNCE